MASVSDSGWAACGPCAELIEVRDLDGLVSRVTAAMPAKLTKGNRLPKMRGVVRQNYERLFATLQPGREEIG